MLGKINNLELSNCFDTSNIIRLKGRKSYILDGLTKCSYWSLLRGSWNEDYLNYQLSKSYPPQTYSNRNYRVSSLPIYKEEYVYRNEAITDKQMDKIII